LALCMKKISREIPQKYQLPRFGFIVKSGNSPLGGFTLLVMKTKARQLVFWAYFPIFFLHA